MEQSSCRDGNNTHDNCTWKGEYKNNINVEDDQEDNNSLTYTLAKSSKSKEKTHKIVELAVFSDSKLTSLWAKKYPKDSKGKLKTFILNLINNVS